MISIVIPLYNKERYIERTLKSVLNQTFQEFEIIIIDDGSTDTSILEVEKLDNEKIRIVKQKNAGVAAARNRGIQESNYDLIAFLDADDEWLPCHLQELVDLKNDFPECDLYATDYKIVDSEGKERFPVDTKVLNLEGQHGVIANYFDVAIKTNPPVWTSAVAVTKMALNEVSGFPVGVRLGEDLLVWSLLADKYSIAYSKEITAIYNFKAYTELLDDEPMPDKNDVVGKSLKRIYETTSKNKSALRKYISLWHRMRANLYIKNKVRKRALSEIIKAIYYNPIFYKNYFLLLLFFLPHSIRTMIMRLRLKRLQKGVS